MKRRRFLFERILILLCIVFSVFSFVVLLIKLNKLEDRVSRLDGKSSETISVDNVFEKIDNNNEDISEWKTTEVTDGIPDSNEYDEFTVITSPENISTYLKLFHREYNNQLPPDNEYDIYEFANDSNVYDKGWVYEEASDDFRLTYSFNNEGTVMFSRFNPFGFQEGYLNKGTSPDNFSVNECTGKLRFISVRNVISDKVDDMHYKREVIIRAEGFPRGKTINYSLDETTYNRKW